MMRNRRNIYLPLILSVLMLSLMFFSAFYIAEEHDHDCAGEDCPICECIHLCEGILYETQGAKFILISAVVAYAFICLTGHAAEDLFSFDTLVSEKVRMDS